MLGVRMVSLPKQPTSPMPKSSARRMTMLGGVSDIVLLTADRICRKRNQYWSLFRPIAKTVDFLATI